MKRIHIITCLAAIFLFGSTSFAQDVKFGLRAGANITNMMQGGTKTPMSEDYSGMLRSGMGIFTEVHIKNNWSVRWGVEYSGLGGKKDGMQALSTSSLFTSIATNMGTSDEAILGALMGVAGNLPRFYYADIENKTKFDYVMIPILAQYTFELGQSPWSLYVNAGPYVSFLVSAKHDCKGTGNLFADAAGQTTLWNTLSTEVQDAVTQNSNLTEVVSILTNGTTFGETKVTGEMKSVNFGVTANVGIRYQYNRNFFFLEAGGNYGFLNVQQEKDNGTNRLGAFSVMLGYAFSFK